MIKLKRPACPDPEGLKANYKHPPNKAALRQASADKCMYCESRVTATYFGDVEHIRPKDKYPELECEWENLGFVCAKCNNAKSNKWETDTPFVDPYSEEPSTFLAACGPFMYHVDGDERGEYTWREIDLNRPELVQARHDRINAVRSIIDKIKRTRSAAIRAELQIELKQEIGDDSPYTAVVRAAVAALLRVP